MLPIHAERYELTNAQYTKMLFRINKQVKKLKKTLRKLVLILHDYQILSRSIALLEAKDLLEGDLYARKHEKHKALYKEAKVSTNLEGKFNLQLALIEPYIRTDDTQYDSERIAKLTIRHIQIEALRDQAIEIITPLTTAIEIVVDHFSF